MEDKKAIVNDVFEKFHDRFGFYPESTGSYYMDADLTNYIKEKYPMVKCAVATCWEEGPKAVSYTHLDVYKRQEWEHRLSVLSRGMADVTEQALLEN